VDALEARRACNVGALKLEIRGGGGTTAAVHVRTNDLTYDIAVEEEFSTLITAFTRTLAPSSSKTIQLNQTSIYSCI
jgi:hypothetical protein